MTEEEILNATPEQLWVMVAEALGWKTNEWMKEKFPDHDVPLVWQDQAGAWSGALPHWPSNIAAAWELDGRGWFWTFDENIDQYGIEHLLVHVDVPLNGRVALAEPLHETAAQTYATARCRAWLLAKLAETQE